MRTYLCAALALSLFFFHSAAHAQKKIYWQRVTETHWSIEIPDPEVNITVMEFGDAVVVLWKWPCANGEKTRNLMQRSDRTLKISGDCWPKSPVISYDSLLAGLRETLSISTPPTELLNLLTQLPGWSDVL